MVTTARLVPPEPPHGWLLDEASIPAIVGCDDPAEMLARKAAGLGDFILHFNQDAPVPMPDRLVFVLARDAFRFADAALLLEKALRYRAHHRLARMFVEENPDAPD
jgi:hypothetical protein